MSEVLFILTAIFVAYVIYVVVNEKKTSSSDPVATPPKTPEKPAAPAAAVKQAAPKPAAAPKKTEKVAEPKPAAKVAKTVKPAVAVSEDTGKRGLKDPKTGEVAMTYSNYRFTKRWIKEALVAEKLLDKVYKNDELTTEIEAKIKMAVSKLEGMAKYKV